MTGSVYSQKCMLTDGMTEQAAASGAMDPPDGGRGRRLRTATRRLSPDSEHARPQLLAQLTGQVLARQVRQLAAREGSNFEDMPVSVAIHGHALVSNSAVRACTCQQFDSHRPSGLSFHNKCTAFTCATCTTFIQYMYKLHTCRVHVYSTCSTSYTYYSYVRGSTYRYMYIIVVSTRSIYSTVCSIAPRQSGPIHM